MFRDIQAMLVGHFSPQHEESEREPRIFERWESCRTTRPDLEAHQAMQNVMLLFFVVLHHVSRRNKLKEMKTVEEK